MTDFSAAKATLEARRAELRARIDAAEAELDRPGDPNIEDQATDRQGDEAIEAVEAAALQEIGKIDAALARIAAGVYGRCVACGEPISKERLAAIPHAAACRDHA